MNPFNRHSRLRENLSAYIDGELSPRDLQALQKHNEGCASCRAELESLRTAASALGQLPPVEAPRSFALTPQMAAASRPAPARAPSQALNTGMRLTAAGLAVALAAVMVVDGTDLGGDGSPDSAPQSADNATTESFGDSAEEGQSSSRMDAPAGEEDMGFAPPAATAVPDAITIEGATPGGSGVGAAGAVPTGAAEATGAPAPADNNARATEAAGAGSDTSDDSNSDADEAATGEAPAIAPAEEADDDGGTGALDIIEVLLAVSLGAAIGGVFLLWLARRQSSA